MRVVIPSAELIGQPDLVAMLQAFYSRSHKPIEERLCELSDSTEVSAARIKDSLSKFFINYGHASIGDCGVLPLFVEGVTMLTAKALQDNPLYNGQESSSRYINFAAQGCSPYLTAEQRAFHNKAIKAYSLVHIRLMQDCYNRGVPQKQAELYAFDKARGYLPATALTQLSLAYNFRQLRHQLWSIVETHPIEVVRKECRVILDHLLASQFKDLFEKKPHTLKQDWFLSADEYHVISLGANTPPWTSDLGIPDDYQPTEVFCFDLDYGSYRDLQRHRSAHIRSTMPCNTGKVHPYYEEATSVLNEEEESEVRSLFVESEDPCLSLLGNVVHVGMNISLSKFKYLVALRTQPTVHHTLRTVMTELADTVDTWCDGLDIMSLVNTQEPDYDKRAKQDIKRTN